MESQGQLGGKIIESSRKAFKGKHIALKIILEKTRMLKSMIQTSMKSMIYNKSHYYV